MKKHLLFSAILASFLLSCNSTQQKKQENQPAAKVETPQPQKPQITVKELDGTLWSREATVDNSPFKLGIRFNERMIMFLSMDYYSGQSKGVQVMFELDEMKANLKTKEVVFKHEVEDAEAQKYSNLKLTLVKKDNTLIISGGQELNIDGTYSQEQD